MVRANFKAWDLDGDGTLTLDEIEKALIDPRHTGDVAVAIATFRSISRYDYARQDLDVPPFTLKDLLRYERAMAAESEPEHDYDELFQEFKEKLASTPRTLFPDKEGPKLTAVKQGHVGDCWFISVIGGLVHMHPEKVRRMVEEQEGKKKIYQVRFDGVPRPVRIDEPTDAEIALYTSARENGLWLTVVEKAFGKHVNLQQPPAERKISPIDVLSGGASSDAVAILTGHGYRSVGSFRPQFEPELMAAVQRRLLIYTSGRAKGRTPGIVHGGHLYGVLDYDERQKLVTVFDPLGEDFLPKKRLGPGLKGGYAQKKGVMKLPLDEFRKVFDGIGYQDPMTPAPDRKKKKE